MSHIFMSHIFMSHVTHFHVTHFHESCHTFSCHTFSWVMSHIFMSHVTHFHESCHTWTTHTTDTFDNRNKERSTPPFQRQIWVMSHTYLCLYFRVLSYTYMPFLSHIARIHAIFESCHKHLWKCATIPAPKLSDVTHMSMFWFPSHVTQMHAIFESRHTHVWKCATISVQFTSNVTHMCTRAMSHINAACHTNFESYRTHTYMYIFESRPKHICHLWVMSRTYKRCHFESCHTFTWVMSHVNAARHCHQQQQVTKEVSRSNPVWPCRDVHSGKWPRRFPPKPEPKSQPKPEP